LTDIAYRTKKLSGVLCVFVRSNTNIIFNIVNHVVDRGTCSFAFFMIGCATAWGGICALIRRHSAVNSTPTFVLNGQKATEDMEDLVLSTVNCNSASMEIACSSA
jgi:hypothetical protein